MKNNSTDYVGQASNTATSVREELPTPRFMWDGYNQVNNLIEEEMPGESAGRVALAVVV
jgi:hypothetical protein